MVRKVSEGNYLLDAGYAPDSLVARRPEVELERNYLAPVLFLEVILGCGFEYRGRE
jgi:hypothetical protein